MIACAEKGLPGEAYNLASGFETSIHELAETINKLTGNTAPLDIRPARDWDQSGRRFGSTTKAAEFLDFSASTSLYSGLDRTIEWTRENMEVIKNAMCKHDRYGY